MKELEELKSEIRLRFCEMDEATGKPKQFKEFQADQTGNKQEYWTAKVTDAKSAAMFDAEMRAFNKMKHEIELHQFKYDRIKNIEINGVILSILMDTIITD